jgi:hypothetical protein
MIMVAWSGQGVMAGLVPAIHAFACCTQDVDARHRAGHDDGEDPGGDDALHGWRTSIISLNGIQTTQPGPPANAGCAGTRHAPRLS